MQDIKKREEKMKKRHLKMSWRDFLQTICSWVPLIFYKNGNGLISRYPDVKRIVQPVKDLEFMMNIDANINKGLDYDSHKDFFENMRDLFNKIQLPALSIFSSENSNFGDAIGNSKSCYLSYSLFACENVLYSYNVKYSTNIFNSVLVWENSENVYFSAGIIKSYHVYYSKYIVNSSDIRFSSNLQGCRECIFCDNLLNQSFCIKNQQYPKEEYETLKKDILKNKEEFLAYYGAINNEGMINGGDHNVGGFILHSENVENGYFCDNVKNVRNAIFAGSGGGYQDLANVFNCGGGDSGDNVYGGVSNAGGSDACNSILSMFCSNCYYTYYTMGCSYCLGCIGLKNKSFCILNKEYPKEERFEIVDKIFQKMEADGILGDFFPGKINPFYFNDTVASLIDDFTKEEVTKEGYLRRDEEIKVDVPEGAEIIPSSPRPSPAEKGALTLSEGEGGPNGPGEGRKYLNDFQGFDAQGNWKINPEILKKVIRDEKGNYYRIVKMEYDFLMKHGLPLPEIHRLERIKLGFRFK